MEIGRDEREFDQIIINLGSEPVGEDLKEAGRAARLVFHPPLIDIDQSSLSLLPFFYFYSRITERL